MPSPRLLVIEGNSPQTMAEHVAAWRHSGQRRLFANLLRELLPGAHVDICYPADPAAMLPEGQSLEGYDGVAITGSSLHVYEGGTPVDAADRAGRATLLDTGTPVFGSCWGLQVITAAAGGAVRQNPKGREIGFGRSIRLTEAGRKHPMYAGKLRCVQRADRASRRSRDAGAGMTRAREQRSVRRAERRTQAPKSRWPGACSIIRNIRCARSP